MRKLVTQEARKKAEKVCHDLCRVLVKKRERCSGYGQRHTVVPHVTEEESICGV